MTDQTIFHELGISAEVADISPDRMDFLTKVFELVCEIYSIPVDSKEQRETLALQIIVDNRSTPDRGKLLEAARNAAENYRKNRKAPLLRLISGSLRDDKESSEL